MSHRNLSLHKAIKAGNSEAVRSLLAAGADVNETNDAGQTPLIIAIVAGQHQCLRPLLRAGADPLLRDHTGLTAIDWAMRKGETQLAQSLSKQSSETIDTNLSEPVGPPAPVKKIPSASTEEAPRTPLSPDEKARRFIAGLKQRMDERADRESAGPPAAPREEQPGELKNEVQPRISETVKPQPLPEVPVIAKPSVEPDSRKAPVIAQSAVQPESQGAPVTSERTPQTEIKASPIIPQRAVQPESQEASEIPPKPARKQTARQASTKAPDLPVEITPPPIVTEVELERETEAFASPSPDQKPSRGSSKRKRCPQCGTIYHSELLAYCSYDAVALVDEGATLTTPRPPNVSPLLWILVVIVALLGAIAGLFVTERLLRRSNVETPTVAATQPATAQKGIPVLRGELEGKEVSLPEAEVPANTVKEPTSVIVRVRVDRQGHVYAAESTDGREVLREAAIEAAKKSTFSIEKLRGRSTGGIITYTFK